MSAFGHKVVLIPNPEAWAKLFGTCEKGFHSAHDARCLKRAEFECGHRVTRPDRKKASQYEQRLCRDHAEAYAANAGIPMPVPPEPEATIPEPEEPEVVMAMPERAFTSAPRARTHRLPRDKRKEIRITIRLLQADLKELEYEADAVDRKLSDYMRHLILTHPLRKAARGGR